MYLQQKKSVLKSVRKYTTKKNKESARNLREFEDLECYTLGLKSWLESLLVDGYYYELRRCFRAGIRDERAVQNEEEVGRESWLVLLCKYERNERVTLL